MLRVRPYLTVRSLTRALGAQHSEVTVSITAVVFDLADVLLEFGGVTSVSRLSRGRIGVVEFGRL